MELRGKEGWALRIRSRFRFYAPLAGDGRCGSSGARLLSCHEPVRQVLPDPNAVQPVPVERHRILPQTEQEEHQEADADGRPAVEVDAVAGRHLLDRQPAVAMDFGPAVGKELLADVQEEHVDARREEDEKHDDREDEQAHEAGLGRVRAVGEDAGEAGAVLVQSEDHHRCATKFGQCQLCLWLGVRGGDRSYLRNRTLSTP